MFTKNKIYKTILITGASSGIGKELAIQYAKKDIVLFLTGRNLERLKQTVITCKSRGAVVYYKQLDIKDREAVKDWVLECDKISNIDLVVANAGISAGTSFEGDFEKQVYEIFNTNIFGILNTIQPIIPEMIKRKKGQIALMSSMSSFIGMASCPAYSSSKSCILSYGEGLRGLLKQYNVGVSIICPGFIKTPLTDKNSFKMPLLMPVEKASKKIIKCLEKNKGLIVFPFIIYFMLKFLRFLPFSFTNYIFSKLPKKNLKKYKIKFL